MKEIIIIITRGNQGNPFCRNGLRREKLGPKAPCSPHRIPLASIFLAKIWLPGYVLVIVGFTSKIYGTFIIREKLPVTWLKLLGLRKRPALGTPKFRNFGLPLAVGHAITTKAVMFLVLGYHQKRAVPERLCQRWNITGRFCRCPKEVFVDPKEAVSRWLEESQPAQEPPASPPQPPQEAGLFPDHLDAPTTEKATPAATDGAAKPTYRDDLDRALTILPALEPEIGRLTAGAYLEPLNAAWAGYETTSDPKEFVGLVKRLAEFRINIWKADRILATLQARGDPRAAEIAAGLQDGALADREARWKWEDLVGLAWREWLNNQGPFRREAEEELKIFQNSIDFGQNSSKLKAGGVGEGNPR